DETLLRGLVVAVDDEGGDHLQAVLLVAGPGHRVELFPAPALILVGDFVHLASLGLPLDDALVEDVRALRARRPLRIGGTIQAGEAHGEYPVGVEAERPEQARRGRFGVRLAIVAPELHLYGLFIHPRCEGLDVSLSILDPRDAAIELGR